MKIANLFSFSIVSAGKPVSLVDSVQHTTWFSEVFNFGNLDMKSLLVAVTPQEAATSYSFTVFTRDYGEQGRKESQQIWNPVEAESQGHYYIRPTVNNGQSEGFNNLQFVFTTTSGFFNISVTMQVSPRGKYCVIAEMTWHGKLYKDQNGHLRSLELERKGLEHPLLTHLKRFYKNLDLPPFPGDYPLWMEKISYGRLHKDEFVVYGMDTGLFGGTYYARDKGKRFVKVNSMEIYSGCCFPTVGTILVKDGDGYAAHSPAESAAIFAGRLDFREDKNAVTRLLDARCSKTGGGLVSLEEVLKAA